MFPGAPIGLITPSVEGADDDIRNATTLVAAPALSIGINDSHTATSTTDRLGAVLCDIVPKNLRTGVYLPDGRVALVVPSTDYDGLVDTMFHMVRQNAIKSTAVLIRLLDALTAVVSRKRATLRIEARHHMPDLSA